MEQADDPDGDQGHKPHERPVEQEDDDRPSKMEERSPHSQMIMTNPVVPRRARRKALRTPGTPRKVSGEKWGRSTKNGSPREVAGLPFQIGFGRTGRPPAVSSACLRLFRPSHRRPSSR